MRLHVILTGAVLFGTGAILGLAVVNATEGQANADLAAAAYDCLFDPAPAVVGLPIAAATAWAPVDTADRPLTPPMSRLDGAPNEVQR